MMILQYPHVLIIFSESINTFVHGLELTKGNIETLVINQKKIGGKRNDELDKCNNIGKVLRERLVYIKGRAKN